MQGGGSSRSSSNTSKIKGTIPGNNRLHIHFTDGMRSITDNCCRARPTLRPFYQSAIVQEESALGIKRVES